MFSQVQIGQGGWMFLALRFRDRSVTFDLFKIARYDMNGTFKPFVIPFVQATDPVEATGSDLCAQDAARPRRR